MSQEQNIQTYIGPFVGKPQPNNQGNITAYLKTLSQQELYVDAHCLQGDEAADKKHHGGIDRVVHHYCSDHYQDFKEYFPEISDRFVAGSMGENICVPYWNEYNVCIGDQFRIGDCLFEVSEPRNPCALINQAYGHEEMLRFVVETKKIGWFYRVKQAGIMAPNGQIGRISLSQEREFTIAAVYQEVMLHQCKNTDFCAKLLQHPSLSTKYRNKITDKITLK